MGFINVYMQKAIQGGTAVDLKHAKRTPDGGYLLDKYVDGISYCDTSEQRWMRSIGRCRVTNTVTAYTDLRVLSDDSLDTLYIGSL